jgi:hypothetical protein
MPKKGEHILANIHPQIDIAMYEYWLVFTRYGTRFSQNTE